MSNKQPMHRIVPGPYYNANGFAIAIVAVITEGIDWAAYIGATTDRIPMERTRLFVASRGCKLEEPIARAVFDIPSLPYRY